MKYIHQHYFIAMWNVYIDQLLGVDFVNHVEKGVAQLLRSIVQGCPLLNSLPPAPYQNKPTLNLIFPTQSNQLTLKVHTPASFSKKILYSLSLQTGNGNFPLWRMGLGARRQKLTQIFFFLRLHLVLLTTCQSFICLSPPERRGMFFL